MLRLVNIHRFGTSAELRLERKKPLDGVRLRAFFGGLFLADFLNPTLTTTLIFERRKRYPHQIVMNTD